MRDRNTEREISRHTERETDKEKERDRQKEGERGREVFVVSMCSPFAYMCITVNMLAKTNTAM